MVICFDVDGVLNDLVEKTLVVFNRRYNRTLTVDDITTYNFAECLPQEDAKKIVELFKEKTIWDSLSPTAGSQKTIKSLLKAGHQIYFATATDPVNFAWKVEWLNKNYPVIPTENIIRIADKSLLKCDVLVDDCLDNLTGILCDRICIDHPWNRSSSKDFAYNIYRVYDFVNIVDIINKIAKEMEEWNIDK